MPPETSDDVYRNPDRRVRKLSRFGQESLCVVIPAAWWRTLGWEYGDYLELERDGDRIIIHGPVEEDTE